MAPADITTIEEQLGIDLPRPFVEAALSGVFTDPLHDDSGSIVGINTSFRSGDFGDQGWNKNLLAFGHDGAGNYFCIDVLNIGDGGFVRDHETRAITKEHDTFSDFLQQWA